MSYSAASIRKALERFPKARLSITPTPIYRLSRLSAHLECSIYIMREDLTGFALGGNKVRKLDYLIGDALGKKASRSPNKIKSKSTTTDWESARCIKLAKIGCRNS